MQHPNPWAEARQRDITITHCRLPDDIDALWVPQVKTVMLARGLTQTERRSALAHELAHLDLGHLPTLDEHTSRAQEVAANVVAARMLIPLDNLVEALMESQDEYEVADALWVDMDLVLTRISGLTDAEKATIDAAMRTREWEIYGDVEESA